MIDLHTHILPGVDDGVQTEDEAVEFARLAAADGVQTIVATPHCREGFYFVVRSQIEEGVHRLRERFRREGLEIELLPGAEVHLCPDMLARIEDGRATTLGDRRKTLLLELSLSQYPVEVQSLVFQLKLAGITTLFAHPERVRYFQDDVRRYEEMVRLGGYGQLTTGSVLGTFGDESREFSEELLRKGLVHVMASDAHNVRGRPPLLREAIDAITPLVGEAYARAMATSVPRALLDGTEPVLPPLADSSPRRRSFLSRWLQR